MGLLSHHVDTQHARRALRQRLLMRAKHLELGYATTAGRKHSLVAPGPASALIEVSEDRAVLGGSSRQASPGSRNARHDIAH